MKKIKGLIILILIFTLIFISLTNITSAENKEITIEFFYTNGCHVCNHTKPIINNIEKKYNEEINVNWILVGNKTSENYSYFNETYGFHYVPAVVVLNQTDQFLFNFTLINQEDIESIIDIMLLEIGDEPKNQSPEITPSNNENGELNIYIMVIIIIVPPIAILLIMFNKKKYKK